MRGDWFFRGDWFWGVFGFVVHALACGPRAGMNLKRNKEAHAKTRRCLDGKLILCVFASLRLCVNVFLFRLKSIPPHSAKRYAKQGNFSESGLN